MANEGNEKKHQKNEKYHLCQAGRCNGYPGSTAAISATTKNISAQ
jgi:hypothetical protein